MSFRPSKIERQAYSYVFRYSTCPSSVRLNKKSKYVIFTSFAVLAYVSSCFVGPPQVREITLSQHPPSLQSKQKKKAQNIIEPASLAKSSWSRSPRSLLNSPRHCQQRMTTLDTLPIQSWEYCSKMHTGSLRFISPSPHEKLTRASRAKMQTLSQNSERIVYSQSYEIHT